MQYCPFRVDANNFVKEIDYIPKLSHDFFLEFSVGFQFAASFVWKGNPYTFDRINVLACPLFYHTRILKGRSHHQRVLQLDVLPQVA